MAKRTVNITPSIIEEQRLLKEAIGTGGRVKPWAVQIKTLRNQQGMSQERLAYRAGVCLATIRRIENDPNASPTIGTMEAIAEALGVDVKELL